MAISTDPKIKGAGVPGQARAPGGLLGTLQKLNQEQIVLGVTVLLVVAFSVLLPGFATLSNLLTMLNGISVLGILALGAAIVIIGRGLDISQITSLAIGAALAALVMKEGGSIGWAVTAGLVIPVGLGLLNGFVVAFVEIPPLFATLATNLLVFGLARVFIVGSTYTVYVPDGAKAFLALGGTVGGVPVPVLVFVVMAVLVHVFLSRTRLGRFVYAHGDNPEAARLTGIAVRPLAILEYLLSALLGYIAGLVLMATLSSIDTQIVLGTTIFDVILVAVLGGVSLVGGRGSVYSVVVGALLIGVIQNGMTRLNLNSDVQDIVRGLVLMAAIVVDNRLHPRDEETARQGE